MRLSLVAVLLVAATAYAQLPACPSGASPGVMCTPNPSAFPCEACGVGAGGGDTVYDCVALFGLNFFTEVTDFAGQFCGSTDSGSACPTNLEDVAQGEDCIVEDGACNIIVCSALDDDPTEGVRVCRCENVTSLNALQWDCQEDILCDECPSEGFANDISGEQCRYRNPATADTCTAPCSDTEDPLWSCTCIFEGGPIGTWACIDRSDDCFTGGEPGDYVLTGPGDCYEGHLRNVFHTVDEATGQGELLAAFRLNAAGTNEYDPLSGNLTATLDLFRNQDFTEQVGTAVITSSDLTPTGTDNLVMGNLRIDIDVLPGKALGTVTGLTGSFTENVFIPGVALLGDSLFGPNTWRQDIPLLLTLYGENGTWGAGSFSGSTFAASVRFEAARSCVSDLDCVLGNPCSLGECGGAGLCEYRCRLPAISCPLGGGGTGNCGTGASDQCFCS